MTADDKEVTRSIIREVLSEIDLVALHDCQQKLQEAIEQNNRLEQNFRIYHELAERRGEQSKQLAKKVNGLETQIALLTSAIENITNGD